MRRCLAALLLGLVGACFDAPSGAVMFSCDPESSPACPSGYSCENDGCCHKNGSDVDAHIGECKLAPSTDVTSATTPTTESSSGSTDSSSSGSGSTGTGTGTGSSDSGSTGTGTGSSDGSSSDTGASSSSSDGSSSSGSGSESSSSG